MMNNKYRIFLDDYREPTQCVNYMHRRIGNKNHIYLDPNWVITKNYKEFVDCIIINGLPELISYDHDLSDEHYSGEINNETDWSDYYLMNDREMTGYDCAKWLVDYCETNGLVLPEFFVHSMNPIGRQNIQNYLDNYRKMKDNEQNN